MRPIDAVQVLNNINWHHKPIPVSEFESGFNGGLNQAMWIITHAPTLTPPNEPLTLEELLRMDGAPVWLDVAGGMWALVDALDGCLWLDRGGSIDIAKFAGKAYRSRPPEGGDADRG